MRGFFRLALALGVVFAAGCNCSDPSTLGLTSCTDAGDCLSGKPLCCEGFCRAECRTVDGGAGGGGGGSGGGTGGASGCVPACALGQSCVAGNCECDALSCPSGCCSGAACTSRTLGSCAPAGMACVACDTAKADRCSSVGECRCGGTAACISGQRCVNGGCVCDQTSCLTGCCVGTTCTEFAPASCGATGANCAMCGALQADNCSDTGTCRCGKSAACPAGQQCGGTGCTCTAASCPAGCCSGNLCISQTASTCGANGSTCTNCPSALSDGCSAQGQCGCGNKAACTAEQRCVGGVCVCDATSCLTGCCAGDVCTPQALSSCGPIGGACANCSSAKADSCSASGACRCGLGPACAPAQTCTGGSCIGGACDAANCPSGCCDNNQVCLNASPTACGALGSACTNCDAFRANVCSVTGACQCGNQPTCGVGQQCQGNTCVCNPTSCPGGCCSGALCTARSVSSCGAPGMACAACPPTADRCSNGACACGTTGALCAPGQRCVAGSCQCDSTSCLSGCCSGDVCLPPTYPTCGSAPGGACSKCNGSTADQCTAGQCTCGTAAACAPGQNCVGGACVCNGSSCPGGCCSDGGVCTTPPGVSACGLGGDSCTSCDPVFSNDCSSGKCKCGTDVPCAVGQRCLGNSCVCDGTSCSGGCCTSSHDCVSPPSMTSCGLNGNSCTACNPMTANACAGGACRCGAQPACPAGQVCSAAGFCFSSGAGGGGGGGGPGGGGGFGGSSGAGGGGLPTDVDSGV